MNSKIKDSIIKIIEEEINPALQHHAGSVQLNDVVPYGDSWKVILDFKGGCQSCPSSMGSTLKSIEYLLREELSTPTLLVESSLALY